MSEFSVTVPGGESRRLKTGGKYCSSDILVTAEGTALPELKNPGSPADLMEGKELIGADGKAVTGAFTLETEIGQQVALIEQIRSALAGKAAGATPDPRAGYQRVEYFDAADPSDPPYFISDIVATNRTGAEIVAAFPALEDRIPMGSREDSGNTRFYVVYPLSASSCYYGFGAGQTLSIRLAVDTWYRLQTNFMDSRLVNVFEEAGTRLGGGSISGTISAHTVPIAIGGYHSAASGAVSSRRNMKFSLARISEGADIVRSYSTARRISDGELVLLDTITGAAIAKAGGGDIIAGPTVDW